MNRTYTLLFIMICVAKVMNSELYDNDYFIKNRIEKPVQFNLVPELLSFPLGQNLPSKGYNADSNRAAIPSRGSVRVISTRRGVSRTNPQYPNAPPSTSTTRAPRSTPIPNSLYDPNYAENGQPLDPFLRLLASNPNFQLQDNPQPLQPLPFGEHSVVSTVCRVGKPLTV
ncbi:hypothetical protein H5410_063034 [Solanum commersonii]|uniref:Uncharacterized protein n=1 Tax=Solanum commersonii TaxID=4109 RepID=A0A9J5WD95_SOLCO|nr:hypothetical protein H5410_063034 [Solanum commersonii]